MSQQLQTTPVYITRQFFQTKRQKDMFWAVMGLHPCRGSDFSDFFSYATTFVHQWQQHLLEGRTVQLISCGGTVENIYPWRCAINKPDKRHRLFPITVGLTDEMWRKVTEIGYELGYFREQGVPPRFISDETMGNIMASIWEMYLVVCYRVLRERNRVKIPSYKATLEIRDANGNVIIPAKRGDCARTIRLV